MFDDTSGVTAVLPRGMQGQAARARIGVTALFLANGAGYGAWAASIPAVKQALGLSATALGGALLAVALGAMLAMPLAGWLGARRGKLMLTGSGAFLALAALLPAFAGSLPVLAGALLLFGAASGSLDVCMNARAAEIERAGGRAIMSSFHAAFSLGGLVGTGLVAAASGLGVGVPGGLLATAALVATSTLGHAFLDGMPDRPVPGGARLIAWPTRAMAGLGALCLLAFLTEGAVADWSGVFLAQVAQFTPALAPAGFAAFSAAMVLGRLTGDHVVRRFGPVATLFLGGLAAAAGVGVAILLPAAGAVGFGLVGLGASNMAPILFSAAARAGAAASTGVAAVATMGYAGMLLGPPIIGVLADQVGLRAALGVLVAAMATIAFRAKSLPR